MPNLNKKDAVAVDTEIRKVGGPRYTYTFICAEPECGTRIRVRSDALKRASGKCGVHSHTGRGPLKVSIIR